MDRLQVFQYYMAVKLHFTTSKYDIFEHKGRVPNITWDNLSKSAPRLRLIEHLARRFDKPKELIEFLVAQYAYASSEASALSALYDPMSADENYALWCRKKVSMSQLIVDDLYDRDIKAITGGEQPEILSLVAGGTINIETAAALQTLYPYARKDYFVFQYLGVIIEKLGRWVRFDKARVLREIEIPNES